MLSGRLAVLSGLRAEFQVFLVPSVKKLDPCLWFYHYELWDSMGKFASLSWAFPVLPHVSDCALGQSEKGTRHNSPGRCVWFAGCLLHSSRDHLHQRHSRHLCLVWDCHNKVDRSDGERVLFSNLYNSFIRVNVWKNGKKSSKQKGE